MRHIFENAPARHYSHALRALSSSSASIDQCDIIKEMRLGVKKGVLAVEEKMSTPPPPPQKIVCNNSTYLETFVNITNIFASQFGVYC